MVKGVSRRVVVVQPRDSEVFEQAIFIIKDGERRDVLREARTVAERYLQKKRTRRGRRRFTALHLALSALCGGLATGAAWAVTAFLL